METSPDFHVRAAGACNAIPYAQNVLGWAENDNRKCDIGCGGHSGKGNNSGRNISS